MGKRTILIIDDEPDTLTFFSSVLVDEGFDVLTAVNGEKGLEILKTTKVDLITLDVTMPEMSGVKCYRSIKEEPKSANIPTIIITGISDEFKTFISSRKQVPAPEGYISKPVEAEKLVAAVKGILG